MPTTSEMHERYWAHNRRVIGVLLSLWLALTLGIGLGARELSFDFFGWPFSFWAAAQGAPIAFVAIIAVYARIMNRLDQAQEGGDAD